jgi:hypothetical protein
MRSWRLTCTLAVTLGVGGVICSRAAAQAPIDASLTCVASWPEVRYRNYGYDHIVHLRSHCKLDAFCTVWSDVSPKPFGVMVAPREQKDILLLRGSPTREFTRSVACRFPHQ